MEEFIAYIIKNLVLLPDEVQVKSTEKEKDLIIEIRVADQDIGKVIGKQGNTIKSLRTIVRSIAVRFGQNVRLEVVNEEKLKESSTPKLAEV